MNIELQKQQILEEGLKHVPFDGWRIETFETACKSIKLEPELVVALFPRGEADLMDYFAKWADMKMMEGLATVKTDDLKIRARIRMAIEKRIEILSPHKEAVSMAFKKLLMPQYARLGATITWRTADMIWTWVGDDATDYNRYTKRGLLSGVIGATMAYWLQQNDDATNAKTFAFLNNRIENVVTIGQNTSKVIKPVEGFIKNVLKPTIKSKMGKI